MLNFDLSTPSRIIFGKGAQNRVGELLKPLAKKILLHYGGGSIKRSGLYDQVVASLNAAGIGFVELGGVVPNPRLSLVREGIALCRDEGVDLILAVGGGSAIDSAKAIAMGACEEEDVWQRHYIGRQPVERALPVATVLTIPASGSESSASTVITDDTQPYKTGFSDDKLRPVISFVNPELFFTLPKNQIANGVADMMSHIFERYFTNTTKVDLTDALCEAVLRVIIKHAPIVYANPANYESWCEIGFAGSLAHNGLLGMGRREDWGCHHMEHELSAIYDVAHGAGLAVLTPAWINYVRGVNPAMFVQFSVNVMGVCGSFRQPDDIIDEGVARLRAFFSGLGLPATLEELGIGSENLELMAKKATHASPNRQERPLGGLKQLYWQDVLNIFQMISH